MGAIFTFLIIALLAGVMTFALFAEGFAEMFANIRNFFIETDFTVITGFFAAALAGASIWHKINGTNTGLAFFKICVIAFMLWFGAIPLIRSTRTNADFKCERGSGCNWNAECVQDFCALPFRDDETFIGKAEFTQANYRTYLTEMAQEECLAIKSERKSDKCLDDLNDTVQRRFDATLSPENCDYLNEWDTLETAIFLNEAAPMPCIGRDQAAAICATFGGTLFLLDDYDWMFDDRKFSCKNTVMSGLDEFTGYSAVLKKREIEALTWGPGCGTRKFHRVCDKADRGNNQDGLCDVFGNLAEWTSDGGAIGGAFWHTSAEMRRHIDLDRPKSWIGFRCVIPKDAI